MAPFPPYNNPLTSVWLLDGNTINNTLITVGEYNITVKSVWRSLTGMKFKLTVSTDIGSDTQNFTLNVQCTFDINISGCTIVSTHENIKQLCVYIIII